MRAALFTFVIILIVAAWMFTYAGTRNMGLMMQIGVPMSLGMEGVASFASFFAFTGMWLVMMVGMMLPSTYPTLLLYRAVNHKRNPEQTVGPFLFGAGYFLVWTAAGTLFYGAYVAIGALRLGVPGSTSVIVRTAGLALLLAGLYQWSRFKRRCLEHCKDPLHFIAEHWREGRSGALTIGAQHGLYCFGCCWGLMTILFVMGVMHLGWMAAIGALILVEKLVPAGKWISHAIGVFFVLLGLVVMLFPEMLSRLSSQVVL